MRCFPGNEPYVPGRVSALISELLAAVTYEGYYRAVFIHSIIRLKNESLFEIIAG